MRRRGFLATGAALSSLATSEAWLGRLIAGENKLIPDSLLASHFHLAAEDLQRVLTECLTKGLISLICFSSTGSPPI